MVWWRRNPALWCRSPIHRYARRTLRDNEAAIRTRCFSRSQPTLAQYKDEDDGKRPTGLSNSDWLQVQHYRRWKRKFQEDPYRALFGASDDMLAGKGLKEWEWVYKSFPRWMVKDMKLNEWLEKLGGKAEGVNGEKDVFSRKGEQSTSRPPQANLSATDSPRPTYPKKVNLSSDDPPQPRERPLPVSPSRASRFESVDYSSPVISPSDPRRPQVYTKTEGRSAFDQAQTLTSVPTQSSFPTGGEPGHDTQRSPETRKPHPSEELNSVDVSSVADAGTRNETPARETPFIEEFLANSSQLSSKEVNINGWRQTALDRRASLPSVQRPEDEKHDIVQTHSKMSMQADPSHVTNNTVPRATGDPFLPTELNFEPELSPTASSEPPHPRAEMSSEDSSKSYIGLAMPQETIEFNPDSNLNLSSGRPKSTPEILNQLPKHDIDFLNADEIRARMGAKKRSNGKTGHRPGERQSLETDFTWKHIPELEPMIQAKILNDQYVRRQERELKDDTGSAQPLEQTEHPERTTRLNNSEFPEPRLDSSTDRLTKWLQTGGDTFAKHFWMDPVQVSDMHGQGTETVSTAFKDGIILGVQKARRATELVNEHLGVDIPATKPLLTRLSQDEDNVIMAVRALSKPRSNANDQEELKRKTKRMFQKLRVASADTDAEYQEACNALGVTKGDQQVSGGFQKRLRNASNVLQKTTKLTRALLFSLPRESAKIGPQQSLWEIGNYLLALQDTQIALHRVVQRCMLILGVNIEPAVEETEVRVDIEGAKPILEECSGPESSTSRASDSAHVAAVDARLKYEVQALKTAMSGLSDDGYSRSRKPTPRKASEKPSPLTHSLFRPFGQQLNSLSRDVDGVGNGASADQQTATQQQLATDRALVEEVRGAYEDVYGPITVHHRQVEGQNSLLESTTAAAKDVDELEVRNEARSVTSAPGRAVSTVTARQEELIAAESQAESLVTGSPTPEAQTDDIVNAIPETEPASFDESPFTTPTTRQTQLKPTSSGPALASSPPPSGVPSAAAEPSTPPVPLTYTILTYDPTHDRLSLSTFTSPTPFTTPAIPLPIALSTLSAPAKFLPHLPQLSSRPYEIITAKPDMLILRATELPTPTSPNSNTHPTPPSRSQAREAQQKKDNDWGINPVDGTARLSPTGYMGVGIPNMNMSSEELKAWEEQEYGKREEEMVRVYMKDAAEKRKRREKRKGGVAGVLKTAIGAGAVCYVAGVVGELLR
ncbi:hypothetical protein BDV95DRAFT_664122 [Massariosphaeria phaeospora]|uniref:Uncharacterized protein n=1 Tax=Massariosphaeria phaeospora TaxID=100035 RepID=A0A7C8IH03_9PLEO|nr:hypothetical protein BDV95DRAFT_664122 [Massariosphaeria phaeospora]